MKLVCFYENVNREYESLLLLKHEMERRGHSVVISHFSFCDWGWHILFSKPDMVLVPWMRHDINVARFCMFRRTHPKIVNLQWEQVYSQKGVDSGLVTIQREARKCYHLCWGIQSRKRLEKEGVLPDHIFINGPLHFDLCRPEFRSYFMSKEDLAKKCGLPENKRWILYISSFSFATLRPDQLKGIERQIGSSYGDFVQIAVENRALTLKWIEDFLQKHPDTELIYRPHPAEHSDSVILEMQKRLSNFHVVSLYSVKQWILYADRIALWFSTSIAEVYALGRSCAVVRPKELPQYYDVEYMIHAKKISRFEEFESYLLRDSSAGQEDFPVSQEVLDEYYDMDPQKTSYMRTADLLEKIYDLPSSGSYDLNDAGVQKGIRSLRGSVFISLLTSLYAKFRFSFSRVIPLSFFKRLDHHIEREKIRGIFEKNIDALWKTSIKR